MRGAGRQSPEGRGRSPKSPNPWRLAWDSAGITQGLTACSEVSSPGSAWVCIIAPSLAAISSPSLHARHKTFQALRPFTWATLLLQILLGPAPALPSRLSLATCSICSSLVPRGRYPLSDPKLLRFLSSSSPNTSPAMDPAASTYVPPPPPRTPACSPSFATLRQPAHVEFRPYRDRFAN